MDEGYSGEISPYISHPSLFASNFASSISWRLGSSPSPTGPTLAQNLDKCLVPESHRIVATEWPGPSANAVCKAATPWQIRVSMWTRRAVEELTIHSTAATNEYPILHYQPL